MSWTAEVKAELSHASVTGREAELALLAGFLRCAQSADLGEGRGGIIALPGTLAAPARLAFHLVTALAGVRPELLVRTGGTHHGARFEILFRDRAAFRSFARRLGIDSRSSLPRVATATAIGRRHFLRGVFLAVGSLSAPSRPPHVEMLLPAPWAADLVAGVMVRQRHAPHLEARPSGHVRLYLKSREAVASFLRDIGAHQALFAFDDAWAMRELRDHVNRQVNAETANLEKTLAASLRQEKAILALVGSRRFSTLPPKLRELARMRLAHPQATLAELGERLGISKSGVNGRMRRLLSQAEGELRAGRRPQGGDPMERPGQKR